MKRRLLLSCVVSAALAPLAAWLPAGTIVHLTAELFKAQTGLFIVHILYKGTALAIPDLVSGKVDVLFDSLPTGLPHVRDGRLRALAVTFAKRTSMAPELPAVSELLAGFESNTWFGLYGPKGLAPEVLEKLAWRPMRRWQTLTSKTSLPALALSRWVARHSSLQPWRRQTQPNGSGSLPSGKSRLNSASTPTETSI